MAKKAAKKESSKESSKEAKAPAKKAKAVAADVEETAEVPAKKEKAAKPVAKSAKAKKEEKAAAAADERWSELKEKHGKEKAAKYAMTGQFHANQAIEHPKLGWGFIISNNNDRLEVVFQEGVKILISNFNQGAKI